MLGSYYIGLKGGKGANALWGGVPENIRPIYTVSMLLCAVGYFIFFFYIIKGLGSNTFADSLILGEKAYLLLFCLLLFASSFWMPLTNAMVSNPRIIIWIIIRIVLAIVALASLGILIGLITLSPRPQSLLYYSSVVGIFWFTVHTGILDAILWPYFWDK